jgi:glycosyltransferase involved in cell wall biosynthesis
MIPTYNCADYLRQTLASVLAQDPGPVLMQIEVIDDCSTRDDPAAVVAELGQGRVGFYRQAENVGHTRNFDTCLLRSRGQLVHLLHGDDCVRPGFYQTMQRPFLDHPEIGAAFCRYISFDEDGNWDHISYLEQRVSGVLPDWLERIAVGQRLQTPSMVVRRAVYEHLGGFDRRIARYGEDWEMWVRIAASYLVWYEVQPLALYRVHSGSITGTFTTTAQTIADLRSVIQIIASNLPPAAAARISRRATAICARTALRRGNRMLGQGHRSAALAHAREALRTSLSPDVVFGALLLYSRCARRTVAEFIPGIPGRRREEALP